MTRTRHEDAETIESKDVGSVEGALGIKPKDAPKPAETKPEELREDMVGADHPANKPRTLFRVEVGGNPHGRGDLFGTRAEAEAARDDLQKNAGPDAQLLEWAVGEVTYPPAK